MTFIHQTAINVLEFPYAIKRSELVNSREGQISRFTSDDCCQSQTVQFYFRTRTHGKNAKESRRKKTNGKDLIIDCDSFFTTRKDEIVIKNAFQWGFVRFYGRHQMWLGFYDIPLMFGGRCRRLRRRRLCRRYLLFTSYLLHTIHHLKLVLIPSASFSHRAIQAVVLQYPLLWKLFNFRSYPAANEADRNKIKIFLQWKNIGDGKGDWCGMCFFPSLGRTLSSSSSSSSLFTVVVWIIAAVAVICSSFNSLQFCIKHGNELFVNGPPFKHASDWTEVIFCSIRDSFIYIQTKKSATYGEKKLNAEWMT